MDFLFCVVAASILGFEHRKSFTAMTDGAGRKSDKRSPEGTFYPEPDENQIQGSRLHPFLFAVSCLPALNRMTCEVMQDPVVKDHIQDIRGTISFSAARCYCRSRCLFPIPACSLLQGSLRMLADMPWHLLGEKAARMITGCSQNIAKHEGGFPEFVKKIKRTCISRFS